MMALSKCIVKANACHHSITLLETWNTRICIFIIVARIQGTSLQPLGTPLAARLCRVEMEGVNGE